MYREFAPSLPLRNVLRCVWTLDVPAGVRSRPSVVIPDNCSDIIVDFSRPELPRGIFIGPATRSISSSGSRLIGLRFKPECGFSGLGLPMRELRDGLTVLRDLWPEESSRLIDELAMASTTNERVGILESVLLRVVLKHHQEDTPGQRKAARAVALLERRSGGLSVDALASEMGISRQHLKRVFDQHVGLSPKFFARVCRLQGVIQSAAPAPHRIDWANQALSAGYFDQSHMVSDFVELTGLSPTRYFADR